MRLLIFTCLIALAGTVAADYSRPPEHTAEYTIGKGPLTVARATTKFYPLGESAYLYRLHLRTTGLATMFSNARLRERSRGRITDNGYRPEEYAYWRYDGDGTERANVRFDWDAGRARNGSGKPEWNVDIPMGTLDRVVSPLQLMHDLSVNGEGEREMTYHIADDAELKTYTIEIGEHHIVEVGAGRFDAVRVTRRSEDGDTRTRLWCAPSLDYLPVKMTQREDGEDPVTLELESVDGLTPQG